MKSVFVFAIFIQIAWCQEAAEPISLPGRCQQTPDPGNCGRHFVHWFYNSAVGKCLQFQWTGCGGNGNRFETEGECMDTCGGMNSVSGDEQSDETSGDDMEKVDPLTSSNIGDPSEDIETPSEPEAPPSEEHHGEENEDDDDDEMDDGTEDDSIIKKYMPDADIGVQDAELLKEVMSRFEVSALENGESEIQQEIDITQPSDTPMENAETIDSANAQKSDIDEQNEDEDDELDDGTVDDTIIQKYMPNADITAADSQLMKEIMSRYDVSAIGEDSESTQESDDSTLNVKEMTQEEAAEIPQVATLDQNSQDETEDEEDEFADDNGQEVDSFIDHLGEAISPEDKETIFEAIANFGAISLKAMDTVQKTMGLDVPENVPQEETAHNDDATPQEENHQPDATKMMPTDVQQTLTDAMHEYRIAEDEVHQNLEAMSSSVNENQEADTSSTDDSQTSDVNKPQSGFVDMAPLENDANEENDDNDEDGDPVDDILKSEKDAIFNPKGMNPEDRFLLSELVSHYDVAVMEEKDGEDTNPQEMKPDEITLPEGNSDSNGEEFDPSINQVETSDNGLLSPRCTLPFEAGPCRARLLMWYFDMESGDCRSFYYGGCKGNGNQFATRRKCLKSCRGRNSKRNGLDAFKQAFHPETKSRIPDGPTQSPTKRITFMMPLGRLFGDFDKKLSSPPLDPKMQIPPPQPKMQRPPITPFNIREKILSISGKLSSFFPKNIQMPNPNREPQGPLPPFSPLHALLLRNLLKPQLKEGRRDAPPQAPPPSQPGLRIIKPPQLPVFQEQHPIPQLLRSMMSPKPENRRPMIENHRFSAGPPRNFHDEDHDSNTYHQFESSYGRKMFAPSMTKESKFDSRPHDNMHFNNINPKNKFTLLQVFVNKPHGQQPQAQSPMSPQAQSPMMPAPKMAQSQQNPALGSMNQQRTNSHPYPAFYSPHPVFNSHIHPPTMWNPPISSPPMSPFYNPYMSYHHNTPFIPSMHSPMNPYPPAGRQGSQRSSDRSHPFERRQEANQSPVVVVTEEDGEEEENDTEDHYACLLPLAPGKCKAFQTRWFFNRESQKCEIFYFTGCAGNANNFQTWEECAATCIDVPTGPRTTLPGTEVEESEVDNQEQPETIIITSTVFPETEEEAKLAKAEVEAGGNETPPSINELRTTTDLPSNEKSEEEEVEEAIKAGLMQEGVVKEATGMSSEYIILMTVMSTVALAVIVLISLSIVHLSRKSSTSKKEKALEAVINHHLYGDIPKLAMVHKAADVTSPN